MTTVEGHRKDTLDHQLERIGWALFLIMIGGLMLLPGVPSGTWLIGTGLIMLGLNAVRYFKGIPTVRTTTTLGIIALAWGALDQARILLGYPPGASFALLLMVIGLVVWLTLLLPQTKLIEE